MEFFLFFATAAIAQEFTVNGIKYETTGINQVKVITNNYTRKIIIPKSVVRSGKTYSVTAIGNELQALKNNAWKYFCW
ncbi:MAG: hypothetical protein LBQ60_20970 [Bacteroidales bacterium]|jgi:hypothetical protein|nr:hypothetical protein [Bacteroidales bacterium]